MNDTYRIRHESGQYYCRIAGPHVSRERAGTYHDRETAEKCAAILCRAGRGQYHAEPISR